MKTFKTLIEEKLKDWENASKPPKNEWKTPKWNGVSLGKVKKTGKYFVYTHRTRSKYYDSPQDIPIKVIEFIESTG